MTITLREEFEEYYDKLGSNLVSFKRDYKDVKNFYSLVQIGTRYKNNKVLVSKCWELLRNPEYLKTADYGGALCVIGYNDSKLDVSRFEDLVDEYLKIETKNPHIVRWQISLSYLCGTLTNDMCWYHDCLFFDFREFNTLILTKQLLACEKLARIYLDNKNRIDAERVLMLGMQLYKEGLAHDLDKTIGKDGTYIHFACCELGLLSDIASQLVKFLHNIDLYYTNRTEFEKSFDEKRFGLFRYCTMLEKRIKELENGN